MLLHLRHDGHSREVSLAVLNVDTQTPDDTIKRAAARHFDIALASLDGLKVDRDTRTGNVVIRPEAVFG